jgi:hypothetical protein
MAGKRGRKRGKKLTVAGAHLGLKHAGMKKGRKRGGKKGRKRA